MHTDRRDAERRVNRREAATPADGRISRMLQPLQGCFRFPSDPGVRFVTPGYRLKSLRDSWIGRIGFIGIDPDPDCDRDTEKEAIGIVYPTRRGLTRNPTVRSSPHASVSGSVSGSESKTKRSIGIDPDPEADHLDAALFSGGLPGEGTRPTAPWLGLDEWGLSAPSGWSP
jgi:hypothetical protein